MNIDKLLKQTFNEQASDILEGLTEAQKSSLSDATSMRVCIKANKSFIFPYLHKINLGEFKAECAVTRYPLSMHMESLSELHEQLLPLCTEDVALFAVPNIEDDNSEDITLWLGGHLCPILDEIDSNAVNKSQNYENNYECEEDHDDECNYDYEEDQDNEIPEDSDEGKSFEELMYDIADDWNCTPEEVIEKIDRDAEKAFLKDTESKDDSE